jgi:hypothetical protein
MPMVIPEDKAFSDLEEKVKKYLKWEGVLDSFVLYFLFCLALPFFAGLLILTLLGIEITNYIALVLFSLGMGLTIGVFGLASRRMKEYPVGSDEWLHYYSYPLYSNLEKYLNEGTEGWKKDYMKRAIESAEELVSMVERRWTVGKFKLAKEMVGTSVSDLVENLHFRLIPTLKAKNEDQIEKEVQIKKANSFAYNLYMLSLRLNMVDLVTINSNMQKSFDKKVLKEGTLNWFLGKMKNKYARQIVPVVVVTVAYVLSYVILTTYFGRTTLEANGISAGILGVILAAIVVFRDKSIRREDRLEKLEKEADSARK